jgi:hypothetical protein
MILQLVFALKAIWQETITAICKCHPLPNQFCFSSWPMVISLGLAVMRMRTLKIVDCAGIVAEQDNNVAPRREIASRGVIKSISTSPITQRAPAGPHADLIVRTSRRMLQQHVKTNRVCHVQ